MWFCEARILLPAESRYSQTPEYYWFVGVCGLGSVVGRASLIIVGRMDGIVFCFVTVRHSGP